MQEQNLSSIFIFILPLGSIWRINKPEAAHVMDFKSIPLLEPWPNNWHTCSRHIVLCSNKSYSIGSNLAHLVSWLFWSWINCRKRVHIQANLSTGHSVLSTGHTVCCSYFCSLSQNLPLHLHCTIPFGTNKSTAFSDNLLVSTNFIQQMQWFLTQLNKEL